MAVDYSKYKYFKVELDRGLAIITINRPEVLNALNDEGLNEMQHGIFSDMSRDEDVRSIVLTGAGTAFCTGADQKRGGTSLVQKQHDNALSSDWKQLHLINGLLDLDKPIIAAVNGPAIGMGATMALFCDIIIASEAAKFADTHIKIGMVAGDGGTVIWPLLIGPAKAKQFLMTGDSINGKEAERIGLVNQVVPPDQLMPVATALARRLADGPTLAIGWTKRSVNRRIRQDVNLLMDGAMGAQRLCYFTDDYQEGIQAFKEKRKPQFKGK
jgi:enoyl-CoA hydratase